MTEEKGPYLEIENHSDPEEKSETEEKDISPAELVPAGEILPAGLPILPLRPRPAFPSLLMPMAANGPLQANAVKKALESATQRNNFV